ncbi:MAG: bifunctional glutamate N-acetyltransferase/amino-acid acetyltransferase ArgJ [Isosphaeraceae bacterium]
MMSGWDGTLPSGYRAGAVKAGIKASGNPDLAVILADQASSAAGVFTTNRIAAAPVQWDRMLVPSDRVRAIVINAGNANAATGQQGIDNARRTAEIAADRIGCLADEVLVASTGVIGHQLPMEKMEAGIPEAIRAAADTPEAFRLASEAIMTTDTRPKLSGRMFTTPEDETEYRVFGMAKGAAMIGPRMATMLAFLVTDARIAPGYLQGVLPEIVEETFNCISVEGHTSTNDTVLLLARRSHEGLTLRNEALRRFARAAREVCGDLARMIADDGEGATHVIRIDVEGCRDREEARTIARAVANSPLVKTAIHGADPNWGRIVSAAGYAGVPFEENELSLRLNGAALYEDGIPLPFDAAAVSAQLRSNREVQIHLTLRRGEGSIRFWTSDLTAEYVRLNADYTT